MGLETYLFRIEFREPLPEQDIVGLFERMGMTHLEHRLEKRTDEAFGSYYFELRTEKGLTEAHCSLAPEDRALSSFSLRFSVLSPEAVVDQTFSLLKKLNDIRPIAVRDTEVRNHIYRQLRKDKIVDLHFRGLEGTEEEARIEKACCIELDADKFRENELGIMKRVIVSSNDSGEVIESGSPTIKYIAERGLSSRFFGWTKGES